MTADEIILQVKQLPIVSETARKLTIQLNEPDLHRDDIVETLRCDNVLTAKVLRICNSAASGLREPVLSVDQALMLLGFDLVFRIVCAVSFSGSLGGDPGLDAEVNGLWSHSLSTAVAAEHLAEVEGYGNFLPSTAFTAGLLHDLGRTILSRVLTPKDRADIRYKMNKESMPRFMAERQVLGADHAEVGACLLKRWTLPELIVDAVADHHNPILKPSIQLSALVYLADFTVHFTDGSPNQHDEEAEASAKRAAALNSGITVEKLEKILDGMEGSNQLLPQLLMAA